MNQQNQRWGFGWVIRQMGTIILVISLAIGLSSCVGNNGPRLFFVEQAVALELGQAQQTLSQQLKLGELPSAMSISQVKVRERSPMTIDGLAAFRVRGTYDFSMKTGTRTVVQHGNPFEVYLQRQKEGKTWRFAQLRTNEDGEPLWITQRLRNPEEKV